MKAYITFADIPDPDLTGVFSINITLQLAKVPRDQENATKMLSEFYDFRNKFIESLKERKDYELVDFIL